jgi:hypothetical protein
MHHFIFRGDRPSRDYRFRHDPQSGGPLPHRIVDVAVVYRLGGLNMLAGRYDPRGIALEIRVVTRDTLGCVMSTPLGSPEESGVTHFITETRRRSDALLARVAEALDEHAPAIAARWCDDVSGTLQLVKALIAEVQHRFRLAA